ncbi:hypothetical protein CTI12_AA464070 [Artemisia annua]|uniref:Uncharacterized protein n=1 Tax=Artemisia annua TaxID=35608 RepID=A0A2U1LQR9_ARTAN|nr:hypothetical protein CTI12_AA464070 [Artemisia annua]
MDPDTSRFLFHYPNIPINQTAASKQISFESDETTTTTPDIVQTKVVNNTIDSLLDCLERGENYGKQRISIRKISRVLRDLSERSFNPQLVSIGPLHRQNKKLQELESLKESYLNDLLFRDTRSFPMQKLVLKECLRKVNGSIDRIRESYAGMANNYNDAELAMMMIMDGCFIIEFCIKHGDEKQNLPNKMQNKHIAMDLILLENQIPFFVLQDLFDSSMGIMPDFSLTDVLDRYLAPYISLFRTLSPKNFSITDDISTNSSDHDHLLGYLHKRYQCVVAKSSNLTDAELDRSAFEERIENTDIAFHSVVELDRSGVNFKHHQESNWLMTIKFQPSLFPLFPWYCGKPTLLMPTLVIDDNTELILRNFIAYEQSFPKDRFNYFTSYACAMQMLIDTQEDVTKLVESRVLVNNLGSNQEAADMINEICKHISLTDFYYTQEFKQMDSYYNGYWPKNIARLRRTYFSSPWNAIALFAAFILFSLTVVQTVFTIRAA